LNSHQPFGRGAFAAVPERVDRQDFHVDAHRIHRAQPVRNDNEMLLNALDGRHHRAGLGAQQGKRFRHEAMGMHIDRFDPPAVDEHRPARRPRRGGGDRVGGDGGAGGSVERTAAGQGNAGDDARALAQQLSAMGVHAVSWI